MPRRVAGTPNSQINLQARKAERRGRKKSDQGKMSKPLRTASPKKMDRKLCALHNPGDRTKRGTNRLL